MSFPLKKNFYGVYHEVARILFLSSDMSEKDYATHRTNSMILIKGGKEKVHFFLDSHHR